MIIGDHWISSVNLKHWFNLDFDLMKKVLIQKFKIQLNMISYCALAELFYSANNPWYNCGVWLSCKSQHVLLFHQESMDGLSSPNALVYFQRMEFELKLQRLYKMLTLLAITPYHIRAYKNLATTIWQVFCHSLYSSYKGGTWWHCLNETPV